MRTMTTIIVKDSDGKTIGKTVFSGKKGSGKARSYFLALVRKDAARPDRLRRETTETLARETLALARHLAKFGVRIPSVYISQTRSILVEEEQVG